MEHWERRVVAGEWFNVGWQLEKARLNVLKHEGVTLREAMTVLDDACAGSEPQHEGGEDREKLVGMSDAGRLLAVALYINPPGDDGEGEDIGFIRILSARKATATEKELYDLQARANQL